MPSQHHTAQFSLILSDFREQLLFSVKNAHAIQKIVDRLVYWTGTSPELAHIICTGIVRNASNIKATTPEKIVDHVVKASILRDWEGSPAATHFHQISQKVLQQDRKDLRLLSYLKILQRGSVKAIESPEYTALLACGLIRKEGQEIKVANAIYAHVFNIAWIEQQIPGMTRPVSINKTKVNLTTTSDLNRQENSPQNSTPDSSRPSAASGLYSKLAVFACCLAIVGAAISAYRQEFRNEAFATQNNRDLRTTQQASTPAPANLQQTERNSTISTRIAEVEETEKILATDRMLFDKGVEHATNSRWLPMVREFCQIPINSNYYTPAQRQLEQWVRLYKEDIEIAKATFTQEESSHCALVANALEQNTPN